MTPAFTVTLDAETDVVLVRDFPHSPARVWRALTEPALIKQWLGPDMLRCEMDARPGGAFLFEWPAFTFSGPILAADPPHHMTHREHFNGDPTTGPTVITDLAQTGEGTRLTVTMRYASAEARAKAVEEGFTDGLGEVYGRMEAVLGEG
ncbi:hypothetical protein GVN21_19690 [Caulobacter sp. SLTY]|nr:hypothetical protein [Caulobacter sp. SLTY]